MTRFVVHGLPVPKGSMRAFTVKRKRTSRPGVRMEASNAQRLAAWSADVREAGERAARDGGGPYDLSAGQPVAACLEFALPRPRSHYTPRLRLRPTAPLVPATMRDDVDKLARAVLDALTGVFWDDDGRVVHLTAAKAYAASAAGVGVRVTIFVPNIEVNFGLEETV